MLNFNSNPSRAGPVVQFPENLDYQYTEPNPPGVDALSIYKICVFSLWPKCCSTYNRVSHFSQNFTKLAAFYKGNWEFKGGKCDAEVFSIFVHENDVLNDFKAADCIAEVLTVL